MPTVRSDRSLSRSLALVMGAACLAGPSTAAAGDFSIAVGAHGGVLVVDAQDQITTSWTAKPRIGLWFTEGVGLEIDAGFSTGAAVIDGHPFFAAYPTISIVGDPIPEDRNSPVRPVINAGGGFMYKSLGEGVEGEAVRFGQGYAQDRFEGLGFFGAGVVVPIVGPLMFRTDVRMIVTAGAIDDLFKSPYVNFEATAGFEVRIKLAKDQDKDGVPDKEDLCISDPEDPDSFEDEDGCPDPDNDSDGVLDAPAGPDTCPLEAEDLDGFEDEDGCPDTDNDDDGIEDELDTCPDLAGTEITNGCPDRDGDLIADELDACPDVAGLTDFDGCPDTDGDGLPDGEDECPTEVGPTESFGCPDGDGDLVPTYRDSCPDDPANEGVDPLRSDGCPSKVFVSKEAIVITDTVQFSSGKAIIRSGSYGLLDDVAAVLNEYPSITSVQVEGHTDSSGDDAKNLALSQGRAEAVVAYLVERGDVSAERLIAKGFGETVPVADNGTSAGRAINRRVAFTILEQEGTTPAKVDATLAPSAPAEPEAAAEPEATEPEAPAEPEATEPEAPAEPEATEPEAPAEPEPAE